MLLPSDVARLVLGYLQEEGLLSTSQAFIHESPNLKEYAEHTTGDGTIPACVFSVFGKGLTTILNEYVAVKTKESSHEVPAVMTSLWKKLDFTLNQIKSLQNTPSISACQRVRSRIGVASMARPRALTMGISGVTDTTSVDSPAHTSHSTLSHSTPVCFTSLHTRTAPGSSTVATPRDSPVQVVVAEQRLIQGPMSPARRKWDTPRKRGGGLNASSGPGRTAPVITGVSTEPQTEEVVDENFPQLVIQNARDKILSDRSLQEKLAENINKILANEPLPQTSKASSSTMEADQSIDEILGLQGEIHMSDDAIHDILEQTESDPAFQALFDLFDYNKNRVADEEPVDGDVNSSGPEEHDAAGVASTVLPMQIEDPGAEQMDANSSDTTTENQKMRAGQEHKARKPTVPTIVKKLVICPNGRKSRIENSLAKLLVPPANVQCASSAEVDSNTKEKASLYTNNAGVTPMDIDELPISPLQSLDGISTQRSAVKDLCPTTTVHSDPASALLPADPSGSSTPTQTLTTNGNKNEVPNQAQTVTDQAASSLRSPPPMLLCPAQVQPDNIQFFADEGQKSALVQKTPTSHSADTTVNAVTFSSTLGSPRSASSPVELSVTSASLTTPTQPSTATLNPSSTNTGITNKAAPDPNNVVSLKIIISDPQNEQSSTDKALTQAISSISGDILPTIYLSSPVRSSACSTPLKANSDEAAQAVSSLQRAEAHVRSPLPGKTAALISSPLTGTSNARQNYIIQLPLDSSSSTLPSATAGYFLVTDPQTTNVQPGQVLLPAGLPTGQPLPSNQFGVTTPVQSQGFSGSALILPPPLQPVMLPVSVMGRTTLGNVQMVPNQLVAISKPVPRQEMETVKSKPKTVAPQQPPTTTAAETVLSAENIRQDDTAKGSTHRRILCFEPPVEAEPQSDKTPEISTQVVPSTTASQSTLQPEKSDKLLASHTKPTILGGNRPKRRVETVRCLPDSQAVGDLMKKSNLLQHQKDPVKNTRKQENSTRKREGRSSKTSTSPSQKEKEESKKRSKSIDRKHSNEKCNIEDEATNANSPRSQSSDSALKSGSNTDKDGNNSKEAVDKALLKPRKGRPEKKNTSQATPNVTANKENEIKGGSIEQKQPLATSSSASRDLSVPTGSQPTSDNQSKTAKAPSMTSSLAKQAAEMLQDIQGLASSSTPGKKPAWATLNVNPSGTGHSQATAINSPHTPTRLKKGKEPEGTPKQLLPPNTPDGPTCSPTSEAGSESSINMAAHTLMILSRAAIGSPLKTSLRQAGVGDKSPASSKNSKKRKQSSPTASPPAKKDAKHSPSKKKEKKKQVDCFPLDLDVDKFLSSLHYDE
ncbi:protein NPAT [Gouania willdenowi]|uniref:Protein NPAT n=1 Tax=Gouania willdenowi TaxID=441366 RepID=A0A8C5DBW6_GOUWI|nr:protein NPAT [Gouania willdenowi]